MNILKLKVSMIATLAAIIGLSTLFFTIILSLLKVFSFYTLLSVIVFMNIIQWLLAPYLIDAMYRAKQISRSEEPELTSMIERLSKKSRIRIPKLMIAEISIPNAFAYGSPLTGNRVAISRGLLNTLESEEVESVLGHELGHLKHRDVQVMMFVSIIPALFYYLGYSMILSSAYGRRDQRNGSAPILLGFLSISLYWTLTLFTLHLSRLREYYADRHSVTLIKDGSRKLSEGLVKIAEKTESIKKRGGNIGYLSSLKTLFISNPDHAGRDLREIFRANSFMTDQQLVSKYLNKKVSTTDQFAELFSTHPNMVKRLRTLKDLA